MLVKYEYVEDLTSDVMFKAYGKEECELFENSALALVNIMYDSEKVKPEKRVMVTLESKNLEGLLYKFLSVILIRGESKNIFFTKFKVKIKNLKLKAEMWGEKGRRELSQTQVKGITFHKFQIKKYEKILTATVIVDV